MHENKKCHHFKAGKAFGFKNSSYICSMKQIKGLFLAVSLGIVALLAISCRKQGEQRVQQVSDVDLQLDRAHQTHNYDSLLLLVDSFRAAGALSDIKTNYWLGYVHQRKGQQRLAEVYWKHAVNDEANDPVSLDFYAKSASRLASLLLLKGDYEETLQVALAAKSRMDELSLDTLSEYSNLLATIGSCQLKLGNSQQAANTFEQAESNYRQFLQHDQTGYLYKSAIVGQINTVNIYLSEHQYDEAYLWTERFDSILTLYERQPYAERDYVDKQRARLNFYRATVLQAMGNQKEAAKAYHEALQTKYAHTGDGHIEGSEYLMAAKRWREAAKNLEDLDHQIDRYGMKLSLENIQKYYLPKFRANVGAQRKDSVIAVGEKICDALDSAIYQSKKDEAAELAIVYDTQQKEAKIVQQEADLSRQRWIGTLAALGLISIFFIIYTLIKRQASLRLEDAHSKLQAAYDQLETTTKAKERIESELRIARDIQMSMVPNIFPNEKNIDVYAAMTPAKEVGGDLYGYLIQSNEFYFCVGDVSGKGVPASLFMAQATRLFRTFATQHMKPADIATYMNAALTENNEQGMFVTMFIGLIDLSTGKMDYCNAGHNPPVYGAPAKFLDMVEANAPIGLWPDLEFVGETIDNVKGRPLLIYSDGLNEAENKQQEQFGDDRLLAVLNNSTFSSSRQVIEKLFEEVNRHRDGAEPNDDLTIMCLKVS